MKSVSQLQRIAGCLFLQNDWVVSASRRWRFFKKIHKMEKAKFARIIRTHPGKTTQQKKTRNINAACASQKLHLLFVGSYNYLAAVGVELLSVPDD